MPGLQRSDDVDVTPHRSQTPDTTIGALAKKGGLAAFFGLYGRSQTEVDSPNSGPGQRPHGLRVAKQLVSVLWIVD